MKKRRARQLESPSRNILHFTDREDEQELFARLLAQPAGGHLPVLSFYGVGGTGKSWLLHRLRESLASAGEVPYAHLDFAIDRGGELYQRDPAAALAEIQRQLGVECPRFAVAYHLMLWKQGKRDTPDSTVGEAASTGWQIAVALGQDAAAALVPGVNVAGKLLEKLGAVAGRKLHGTALGRWLESRGSNQFLKQLLTRTAQEISTELVDHLAEDLHEQLPARKGMQCRAVLFFDTFEDLVRGTGRGDTKERAARQQWIQELYRALLDDAEEPHGTVLLVVAGRDRLVWHEDFDDARYLDQHRVGGLSERDARRFLESCGIEDAALQEAILRVSTEARVDGREEAEPGYHPFSLGLCADTVVSERARGAEPDAASFALSPGDLRALVERFLASFDAGQEAFRPWMLKLALPPRWDEQAARKAYSPVDDAQQDAAWDALTSYSFVQPPTADDPWWSLHVRMRDTLRAHHAENPERERRDHDFWYDHWYARDDGQTGDYAGLAWYHVYCQHPDPALEEWTWRVAEAREQRHMAEHYELLGWWAPTGLLERTAAADEPEAAALLQLAGEFEDASLGDRAANLDRAIAGYEAALHVYTEEAWPEKWARTMRCLGTAYRKQPLGDHLANLDWAIECFEAALRVHTEESYPEDWAATMNDLGLVYADLPTGDRAANLRRAIECYEAALHVYHEETHPWAWALIMNNLGNAYNALPAGDRAANLQRAIECFEAALRVHTEESDPESWARAMNNLGNAYKDLSVGDRSANVQRAIECYKAALRVFTEDAHPWVWAMIMTNLGNAYKDLPAEDRTTNPQRAIECYEAALRIHTEEALAREWATTMNNLGVAYAALSAGDPGANLRQAIACYEAALRVRTEEALPADWAATMNNLGLVYADLPTGDRAANLRRAIEYFEAALRVYTEDAYPEERADLLSDLGRRYSTFADLDALEDPDRDWKLSPEALREKLDWLARAREAFLHSARAYRRIGREEEAREVDDLARQVAELLAEVER